MTIGERIKAKRIEKGLSQRDLAKLLGYSTHTTLTKIESGQVDISQSKIAKFANLLGTTPAYLMGWTEEEQEKPAAINGNELSPEKLELIARVTKMTDAELKKLDMLLKIVEAE